MKSSINTFKFTYSVLNEYFNEHYSNFMHMLEKKDDNNKDFLTKDGIENENKLSEFLYHSVYLKHVDIMKFVETFIIDNCDNFVIEDIIVKILDECFDIDKSEDIIFKFENNENEFLKFIKAEQARNRLKRIHSDLGESDLNDKSLKTLPLNKKKLNAKEKFIPKSSSESLIDYENQNKSSHSLSVDTQTNNITINNNSFFLNNNPCSFKANKGEINFKNIKEKLIDRSFDTNKHSNSNLFTGGNDLNKKVKNDLNRLNKIKNNMINNNSHHTSSNLNRYNNFNFIENSNKFFSSNNITSNSILSFENEKLFENSLINSNLTIPNTNGKSESDLNSIQNINNIDLSVNYNSNLSLFKKGDASINSLYINSNNKSTNASNNTYTNNLSFKNTISNEIQLQNLLKMNKQNNYIELGFNKNNNISSSEIIDNLGLKNKKSNPDKYSTNKDLNNNLAKNKLSSGINAKLNCNVANIQKLKKEKSKKKSSKNKPEIINKLFEKLTEKVNKSNKHKTYDISIKNESKQLNLISPNQDLNNKNNLNNDLTKYNFRQKGVDEYFEKLNQDNTSNMLKKEDGINQKNQLKVIINDNFYLKIKNNKTPENLENPKFSKRKNNDDKINQELKEQSKENLKQNSNYKEMTLKDKYSEKTYNLLRINKKTVRSNSEEHLFSYNSAQHLKKIDNIFDEIRVLSKSPVLSNDVHTKFEFGKPIINGNDNNYSISNKELNNISSDDEVLAYSTPTKILVNRNIRKTSKDKDTQNNNDKNNSGINLLNLFKQIKK